MGDYNERFHWVGATQMKEDYIAALQKGLPFPILTVGEYFTVDAEGFCWGRNYREAGYYTSIFLWMAFALWVLSNLLLIVVPRYGANLMTLTGVTLHFGTPFDRHTIIEDSQETKKKKKIVPKLEEPAGAGLGSRLLRRLSKRDREGRSTHPDGGVDNYAYEMEAPKSPWRYPHLMFRADSRKQKSVSFRNSHGRNQLELPGISDGCPRPPSNVIWPLGCLPRPLQQVQEDRLRVKRGQSRLHGLVHPEQGQQQEGRQKCWRVRRTSESSDGARRVRFKLCLLSRQQQKRLWWQRRSCPKRRRGGDRSEQPEGLTHQRRQAKLWRGEHKTRVVIRKYEARCESQK